MSTKENLEITLTSGTITLEGLIITKSVILKGSPGSSIILNKDPIIIKKGASLEISATTFISNTSKPIFEVKSEAQLSLIDCATTIDPTLTTSVCVHISSETTGRSGSVKIASSSFNGFFTHLICGQGGSVSIENSSFTSSINASILAINPINLTIKGSEFKDCGESCIEVRYVTNNIKPLENEIMIIGNTLFNSKAYGIHVCSEKEIDSIGEFLSLTIESNTITEMEKGGIQIKNLTFYKQAILDSNEIRKCNSNGIGIISSYSRRKQEPLEIIIKKNIIENSKFSGLYISKSICRIIECELSHNYGCGVKATDITHKIGSEFYHVSIIKSNLTENQLDGIEIFNSTDCKILLEENEISQNLKDGIRINCESSNLPYVKPRGAGKIVIKKGNIINNCHCGIEIAHDLLFFDQCKIQANIMYAMKLYGKYDDVKYCGSTISKRTIIGTVISNGIKVDIYQTSQGCTSCVIV